MVSVNAEHKRQQQKADMEEQVACFPQTMCTTTYKPCIPLFCLLTFDCLLLFDKPTQTKLEREHMDNTNIQSIVVV